MGRVLAVCVTKRGKHEGTYTRTANGRVRVSLMVDGHRRSKTCDTRGECQAWVRKQLNLRATGYRSDQGKETLGEYLAEWLERRGRDLRATTLGQYRSIVQHHILPDLGAVPLAALTVEMVDGFYARLDAGVSEYISQYVHRILRKAMGDAVRYGKVALNPTDGATVAKLKRREMSILDEHEVALFLMAARESRFAGMFQLAVVTGMRQGELIGLQWGDVDWDRAMVNVRRQGQFVKGQGIVMMDPKTKAGKRVVKVGENTLQVLRMQQEHVAEWRMVAGNDWEEQDLIFPNYYGRPLNRSIIYFEFKKVLQRAGLEDLRFHDLRHTAVSIMLNAGVPVIVVSRRVGHANASITLNTYGHLMPSMQDEAARLMDDLVVPMAVGFSAEAEMITRDYPREDFERHS